MAGDARSRAALVVGDMGRGNRAYGMDGDGDSGEFGALVSREDAMVVLREDANGKPAVWCDPDIADIVKALIDAGLVTKASCCGHGHQPGSVCLSDGREVLVVTYEQARFISKFFPGINGEPAFYGASAGTDREGK